MKRWLSLLLLGVCLCVCCSCSRRTTNVAGDWGPEREDLARFCHLMLLEDGTCFWNYSTFGSIVGTYKVEKNDVLVTRAEILNENNEVIDHERTYVFHIKDGKLIFDATASDNWPFDASITYVGIKDGDVFEYEGSLKLDGKE